MKNANANDDVAYWKFLVDEAEQFFNGRINEVEQVCINLLIEVVISASKPPQLARKSYLDSEAVRSMPTCGNENEDPLHIQLGTYAY